MYIYCVHLHAENKYLLLLLRQSKVNMLCIFTVYTCMYKIPIGYCYIYSNKVILWRGGIGIFQKIIMWV